MNRIIKFVSNPLLILAKILRVFSRYIPDKIYITLLFRVYIGKWINWKNPTTYNEKMQWLKLYDRNPFYSSLVDKYEVRRYVENCIGPEYLIPMVGGPWNTFDDINFSELPDKFVLKTTHDSGGVVICRSKDTININAIRNNFTKRFKSNLFYYSREWPYKSVKPRIIAETFMTDGLNKNLPVYKFFCFNGVPRIIQTIQNDKQPNETIDYFDTDWNLLNLKQTYPNSELPFKKPELLADMIEVAKKLSKGFVFIRIDLYTINSKIYFSEFTFYSDGGLAPFFPEEWDHKLGNWIELSLIR